MKLIIIPYVFSILVPLTVIAEVINLDVVLNEDKTITSIDDLVIKDGVSIQTNGYSLTIFAKKNLIIEGKATIHSFSQSLSLPKPEKAHIGKGGSSARGYGESGGNGGHGLNGIKGIDGKHSKDITLFVTGNASGELEITNHGSNGGDGGDGGNGGHGGAGGQGHRAKPKWVLGVAAGCKSGPGRGGVGGTGGNGGKGGDAGNGGSGGRIQVFINGNTNNFKLLAKSDGGSPGIPGKRGDRGLGGFGGESGRGAAGCSGGDRPGKSGEKGNIGDVGKQGIRGASGEIIIKPISLLQGVQEE